MGPLDRLRVVRPFEELTADTGGGVGGGGVTDLGDGAATIVEVRGDFSKMPPFTSSMLSVDGGDDVGDDIGGPRGAKRESVPRQL